MLLEPDAVGTGIHGYEYQDFLLVSSQQLLDGIYRFSRPEFWVVDGS